MGVDFTNPEIELSFVTNSEIELSFADEDDWHINVVASQGLPGPPGADGETPLHIGEMPPSNTSWLWLDTSGESDPGAWTLDGGTAATVIWDRDFDGGDPDATDFNIFIDGGNLGG